MPLIKKVPEDKKGFISVVLEPKSPDFTTEDVHDFLKRTESKNVQVMAEGFISADIKYEEVEKINRLAIIHIKHKHMPKKFRLPERRW